MIGVSRLYLGVGERSDSLRYSGHPRTSGPPRPVVVWNATQRCNLSCAHCYSHSNSGCRSDELSPEAARRLVDDLADFGVPALLLSGGEPLARPDVPELAARAVSRGVRTVISTNGTLIDAGMAARLKDAGVSYIGVSIDGPRPIHDLFRGASGAFDAAMAGVRACLAVGLKVGLRLTIHKGNVEALPEIFELIRLEGVQRACFYHFVRTGRGSENSGQEITPSRARAAVDLIIDSTASLWRSGRKVEILTVDNHCDGGHLYLRMTREGDARAGDALALLRLNGGNGSGRTIGCVSWDGKVHPDQFWRSRVLGDVGARSFSEIWSDESNELIAALRNRRNHLKGRCASCRFLDICNGNLRARAEAVTGDPWASDPGCYLTDEEIR